MERERERGREGERGTTQTQTHILLPAFPMDAGAIHSTTLAS